MQCAVHSTDGRRHTRSCCCCCCCLVASLQRDVWLDRTMSRLTDRRTNYTHTHAPVTRVLEPTAAATNSADCSARFNQPASQATPTFTVQSPVNCVSYSHSSHVSWLSVCNQLRNMGDCESSLYCWQMTVQWMWAWLVMLFCLFSMLLVADNEIQKHFIRSIVSYMPYLNCVIHPMHYQ